MLYRVKIDIYCNGKGSITKYLYNSFIQGNLVESFVGVGNSISNYTAYGIEGYYDTNDGIKTFGYCGQQYDWETGNYYMRARYYNPGTGRFISEDPIKDGSNWYSYLGGNPVMFWNSFGLYGIMINKEIVEILGDTAQIEHSAVFIQDSNGT